MTTPTAALDVRSATSLDALVAGLVDALRQPVADLFDLPTVVTPGAAHHRHVSQAIARGNEQGISSGLVFETMAGLEAALLDQVRGDSPDLWSEPVLARTVLGAMDAALTAREAWARPLADHLRAADERSGRRLEVATRWAHLLRRYARLAPQMLREWENAPRGDAPEAGPTPGVGLPGVHHWQPPLWRSLPEQTRTQAPWVLRERLGVAVREGTITLPPALHVLSVSAMLPTDMELLALLSERLRVTVWQYAPVTTHAPHPWARVHAGQLAAWSTLLGRPVAPAEGASGATACLEAMQTHMAGGSRSARTPGGLTVLNSHHEARQVEVLRDHLCALFEDDPTLESRDVVVACPDVGVYAPLVQAAFSPVSNQHAPHPGRSLRVGISHLGAQRSNDVLVLLERLLALRSSRATRTDLTELCQSPPVAHRFGFGGDDAEELQILLDKADVRWGIDQDHRRAHGIHFPVGTWANATERLALSAAFSDASPVTRGAATTATAIDSQKASLAGRLAELVARVRRFLHLVDAPAPATVWNQRLQELILDLVHLPPDQRWQVAEAQRAIADWAGDADSDSDGVLLGVADVRRVVAGMARTRRLRPSFGTGSLLVTDLADIVGIPHRVVVLMGLDDFPGSEPLLGDDALGGVQLPGVPSQRELRQAQLLAAVMSARDQVTIINRGWSHDGAVPLDLPVAVDEVVRWHAAACGCGGQVVHDIAPLAWSMALFDAEEGTQPWSFDARAASWQASNTPVVMSEAVTYAPIEPDLIVDLDDLVAFLKHPARAFLRRRAGLSLMEWGGEGSDRLTLVDDGLAHWQSKVRMLDNLLQGARPADIVEAEKRRGTLPPTRASQESVDRQMGRLLHRLEELPTDAPGHEAIDLTLDTSWGAVRLVGAVPTWAGTHRPLVMSRLAGTHVIETAVQVAALSLTRGQPCVARVQGDRHDTPVTVDHERAREWLTELVELRHAGLCHPVVAPVRTLWTHHTQQPVTRREDDAVATAWKWERDADWRPFAAEDVNAMLQTPVDFAPRDLVTADLAAVLFSPVRVGGDR